MFDGDKKKKKIICVRNSIKYDCWLFLAPAFESNLLFKFDFHLWKRYIQGKIKKIDFIGKHLSYAEKWKMFALKKSKTVLILSSFCRTGNDSVALSWQGVLSSPRFREIVFFFLNYLTRSLSCSVYIFSKVN